MVILTKDNHRVNPNVWCLPSLPSSEPAKAQSASSRDESTFLSTFHLTPASIGK